LDHLIQYKFRQEFQDNQKTKLMNLEEASVQQQIIVRDTKASKGHASGKPKPHHLSKKEKVSSFTLSQFQNIPSSGVCSFGTKYHKKKKVKP